MAIVLILYMCPSEAVFVRERSVYPDESLLFF